jgi:hypothetical protein
MKRGKPVYGQKILVWDDNEDMAEEGTFSSMGLEIEKYPVRCVPKSELSAFERGEKYDTMSWEHWKPIPAKRKLTISEIAEKFELNVDQIEIINT